MYHHLRRKFAVLAVAFGVIALIAISPLSAFAQATQPPPISFCLGGIPGQPCPSGSTIVNPPPTPSGTPGLPPEVKNAAVAELFGVIFLVEALAALALLIPPAAPLFFTLGVGTFAIIPALEQVLFADPPDPNFKVLVHPVLSPARHVTAGHGITQREANAINALEDNLSHVSILEKSLATSMNRAQGAHLARNSMWEARQLQTAKQLARRIAVLLRVEPTLFKNVQDAFKSSKFRSVQISSGASFPQLLTNPSFTTATLQFAQALEQFASRGVVHVVNNQSVKHTVVHAHKNR